MLNYSIDSIIYTKLYYDNYYLYCQAHVTISTPFFSIINNKKYFVKGTEIDNPLTRKLSLNELHVDNFMKLYEIPNILLIFTPLKI